jgi:glycosyltransferase involved in cell wall biosynthesis
MGLVRSRIAAQIAISAHVARSIEGESVVIHPGVEALDGAGPRERTVLLVQRLEPEKATEVAISAWAALGEQRDGWRLVIVGDGSQRSALEAQAAADGVGDSVDFVGFTPDVSPLLTRAAVFVATTPNEGLGLAVVEAMSAGTPVIAPGSGGYLETVGMVEGSELYRPSDAADLAARLRLLLEDESRRTRYGRALRDRQREHFSPESQARATRLIYDSVLQ